MRKVVTTYINPDMDGIALMYAYVEFLMKKGEKASCYFEGTMKKEAEIVLNRFNTSTNKTKTNRNKLSFINKKYNNIINYK